jgi:hypothetical protein
MRCLADSKGYVMYVLNYSILLVKERQVKWVLPNWLMLREKWHIAALLGRCGTQRTLSTPPFLAPGVPCTLPLLTKRMNN